MGQSIVGVHGENRGAVISGKPPFSRGQLEDPMTFLQGWSSYSEVTKGPPNQWLGADHLFIFVRPRPDQGVHFKEVGKQAQGWKPAFQRATSLDEIYLTLVVPIVEIADDHPITPLDAEIDYGAFHTLLSVKINADSH